MSNGVTVSYEWSGFRWKKKEERGDDDDEGEGAVFCKAAEWHVIYFSHIRTWKGEFLTCQHTGSLSVSACAHTLHKDFTQAAERRWRKAGWPFMSKNKGFLDYWAR